MSIASERIVEIGAVNYDTGLAFGIVINPGNDFLDKADGAVHGISRQELQRGTSFENGYMLFRAFLQSCVDMAMAGEDSTDEENPSPPKIRTDHATLLLVAHNGTPLKRLTVVVAYFVLNLCPLCFLSTGRKFDYPLLAMECLGHGTESTGLWPRV